LKDDIQNNWGSVTSIAAKAATIAQYAAPGGFNDLDMMVNISLWLFNYRFVLKLTLL